MNSSASHPGQRFSARLTDDVLTGRTLVRCDAFTSAAVHP